MSRTRTVSRVQITRLESGGVALATNIIEENPQERRVLQALLDLIVEERPLSQAAERHPCPICQR